MRSRRLDPSKALIVCMLVTGLTSFALAEERLIFHDGFSVVGTIEPVENRIVVHSQGRLVITGSRQVLKTEPADDVEPLVRFAISQPNPKRGTAVSRLTQPLGATPFDEFGRRTVQFKDGKGNPLGLVQGISEIFPTHVQLTGLTVPWRSSLALVQIPTDQLLPVLERNTSEDSLSDQMKLLQLFAQAGRFDEAERMRKKLLDRFSSEDSKLKELTASLQFRIAERALLLAKRAWQSGQIQRLKQLLAGLEGSQIPVALQPVFDGLKQEVSVSQGLQDQVRELVTKLSKANVGAASSIRDEATSEMLGGLSAASVDRLRPLADLAGQLTANPDQQLALAITGWTFGPELAQRDVEFAIRAWRMRNALRQAVQTSEEADLLQLLGKLQEWKATPDLVALILQLLPAPAPAVPTGETAKVTIPESDGAEYHILLPKEYDPCRFYPTIMVLPGVTSSGARSIEPFRRDAAERGYILVAPVLRDLGKNGYRFSAVEHGAILATLRDARRRFSVDPDRVFLSGYELGGVAAWDIGLGHPSEFAGLVTVCGVPLYYGQTYWPNARHLPLYSIEGVWNGDQAMLIEKEFGRYLTHGFNAMLVEYPGCGRERFPGELPSIFDWMEIKRRKTHPNEFQAVSARPGDNHFYWVRIDAFLANATVAPQHFRASKFRPAKIDAKCTASETLTLQVNGIESLSLLLPFKLVHLDAPELTIQVNGKTVHRGAVEPQLDTLVKEFRRTWDRKNLIAVEISVPKF